MFSLKKNASENSINMCSGPIFPLLMRLSVPVLFSSLMTWCLHAADMIVVGKFVSDSALAAVSAAGTPSTLIGSLLGLLSVGASVCCAHAFGSGDEKRIEKAVHTTVIFGVIIGIINAVIGVIVSDYMLDIMMVPDSIAASTSLYMKITLCGTFPWRIHQYAAVILQVKGDVKRPTLYAISSGVLNVVLNLIFVLIFHLDVAGVAIATFASNVFSAVLSVRALMKDTDASHLDIRKLRIDPAILKDILRIGVPAALRGFLFTLSSFFTDSAMNSFNNDAIISGHGAGANIENLIRNSLGAVNTAAIVIIGQNYGNRNYKRIVKTQWYAILTILGAGIVLGGGAALLSDKLLIAYISTPEAISYGATRMAFITAFCFFDIILDTFTGVMQNCKYSVVPMVISFFSICVFRTIWIFTVFKMYPTYETLLTCYPISYVLSVTALGITNIFIMRKVKRKFAAENELVLQ